jgi:hypothetical protein
MERNDDRVIYRDNGFMSGAFALQTVQIGGGGDKPGWEIAAIVVSALATVAVAGTAIKQLLQEKRHRTQLRESAEADVSAQAFLLRRRLLEWVEEGDWERREHYSTRIAPRLTELESMASRVLEAALNAGKTVSDGARSAFILLLGGTSRLREFQEASQPNDPLRLMQWAHLVTEAHQDIADCIEQLESRAIAPALLAESREIEKKRATRFDAMLNGSAETGDADA